MRTLHSERGHIGVTLASLLAVAGTILLAIGLGHDRSGMSVGGAIVLGVGSLLGMQAPHIWMRSVYRRLDKVDPNDHEALPNERFRTQF
jgi:hypothetical protein